jgi:hypothetical protein
LSIDSRILEHHVAVLGKSGAGKSYAAKSTIVEPLLDENQLVVVVDPTSAWFGLRYSADGKGPGFKVLVLGGDHGDLPLPANGGTAVARLIIEQRVPCVLDTGNLTVGERTRWMIEFAGTIYRLNRSPLYLVIDEAHVFAPQGKVPDPDTGRMLHAVNQIAAGGRSRGIRLTMITQRPQKLHKDSLTTADTLIAMRVLAPQDRAAVKDWIDGCGDQTQGKQVLDSLAQLKRGEGWLWYPEGGILTRMHFPRIRTFDSSATPTHGHELAQPKGAAELDLSEIKTALADAVKEAEANDPKVLRKRIAELEAEIKKRPVIPDMITLEREYKRGFADGHTTLLSNIEGMRKRLLLSYQDVYNVLSGWTVMAGAMPSAAHAQPVSQSRPASAPPAHAVARSSTPSHGAVNDTLPKAERSFLTVLAQQARYLTRNQVAVFSGYSATSRHVDNVLASLRAAGLVEGTRDAIRITEAGIVALGPYDPLPTGRDLQDYWIRNLDKAASTFLRVICAAYPGTLSRAEVAIKADYSPESRHVDNTLAQLRSRDLIRGPRAAIRASEELF